MSDIKKGAIIICTVLLIGVIYLNSPYKSQREIRTVSVVQAEKQQIADYLTLHGTVTEQNRKELYPKSMSKVLSVAVTQGQAVQKGDVLMTLQTESREEALAAFYGEIEERLQDGTWDLPQPERMLSSVPTAEIYAICSPINGTVMDIYGQAGELLSGVFPCIAVSDLNHLGVEAEVSEENSVRLQAGMACSVIVDAVSPAKIPGVITSIAPYASTAFTLEQEAAATVGLTVGLQESGTAYRPGYSAELRIPLGQEECRIVVPYRCLAQDEQGEYILYIREGMAVRKDVQTGRELADGVEIISELQPDILLIENPENYAEGERVQPQ